MLIDRKEYIEEDGSLGYVETIFKSDNILKTLYFPKINLLYISFSRGDTYSYLNINEDLYKEFEAAESHGKFFYSRIFKKTEYPTIREFGLYENEINEIKSRIKEVVDDLNEQIEDDE